jgi:hypothetical protein
MVPKKEQISPPITRPKIPAQIFLGRDSKILLDVNPRKAFTEFGVYSLYTV